MRKTVSQTDRIGATEAVIRSNLSSRVLEIGAGDYSFDYLKPPMGMWTKIDFSPPCDIICDLNSDKLILPFPDSSYDLVICTEVLEHLLWPHQLLKEVHRVISSEGKLLVSIPNIASLSYRLAWLFGRIPSCAASGNLPVEMGSTAYLMHDGSLMGGHVIDFNAERIKVLLQYASFEIKTLRGSGIFWHCQILPHWLIPVSLSSNIICLAKKL